MDAPVTAARRRKNRRTKSKPVPAETHSKDTLKAKRARSSKKGIAGWVKVMGLLIAAAIAYYFIADSDYRSDGDAYISNIYNDDPEILEAREDYLEAFAKYTKLATEGSEGDIEAARDDYERKHNRFKQLVEESNRRNLNIERTTDLDNDLPTDTQSDWDTKRTKLDANDIHTSDKYLYGIDVDPDPYKAFQLYEAMAGKGDVNAMVNLYEFYSEGIWVDRDIKKARALLEKAAANGSIEAEWELEYLKSKNH